MNDVKSPHDNEIVRKVLSGDRDAFRALVYRHKDYIFTLCMRQLGNHSSSEELSQEIFIRAFRSLSQFRFEASFRTWITRIALNQIKNHFASRSFRYSKQTEAFEYDSKVHITATHFNSHQELESKEFATQFLDCFGDLESRLRQVMTLCGFEGESYQQVAEILKIPVGTVRSRLNRARLTLKDCLQRRGGE